MKGDSSQYRPRVKEEKPRDVHRSAWFFDQCATSSLRLWVCTQNNSHILFTLPLLLLQQLQCNAMQVIFHIAEWETLGDVAHISLGSAVSDIHRRTVTSTGLTGRQMNSCRRWIDSRLIKFNYVYPPSNLRSVDRQPRIGNISNSMVYQQMAVDDQLSLM